jgi:hypothetical protein
MKNFIIKTLAFSFVIILVFIWVCSKANGYTDPFYIRFTTPKQNSLILGTSRAAQGLQPKTFETILKKNIYNYSFTVAHSPFGKTYLNSIKKKINTNSKDGIFIITVDPWSLSSLTETPDDSLSFRELKLPLANTPLVSVNPNIIYLINNWNDKYYKLLSNKKSKMFLHKDGWLEVNINLDSIDVIKNIENKEKIYRENLLPKAKFSKTRFDYLKRTINFLNNYGEVYLVRLPIHPKIMQIENELMPEFNNLIKETLVSNNGYLDLTNQNTDFNYTDGNHLHKTSGKEVSEIIAFWIYQKNARTHNTVYN